MACHCKACRQIQGEKMPTPEKPTAETAAKGVNREAIETGVLYRTYTIDRGAIDAEKRTVALSFSSEEPYGRWFGTEILSHKQGHVDLSFLKGGRAPLLVGHWTDDLVGVIESAKIDKAEKKGRAVVRFGNSARAQEIFDDVQDGIRQNVSVGYHIKKMVLEEDDEEKGRTYRATDWKPLEVSLVAIPADESVGVGRQARQAPKDLLTVFISKKEDPMPDNIEVKETPAAPAAPAVDVEAITKSARKAEAGRVREIMAIGQRHNLKDEAFAAINDGTELEDFRADVLEALAKRKDLRPVEQGSGDIGLTATEARSFSFFNAIRALAYPTDRKAQEAAAFEREASDAVSKVMGRAAQGLFVPAEVLRRDLTVGTDAAGGYLVGTDHLAANFIELLRNKMRVREMGATIIDGLVGDVAIPKLTGGAAAYWVAESGAPTEGAPTFGQLAMAPKTVAAYTDISRKLLKQSSPSAENITRQDLSLAIALALDLAGIAGTGADNQPTGILATTGIGAVVCGDPDGAAPTWADIVGLETEVAVDNADIGALGYLTNAKMAGKLKTTEKAASTAQFIWPEAPAGRQSVNGYKALVSNQVPSDLTKGGGSALSAMIYGNWADLIIALWGTLDLTVDPYTGSTAGTLRVVALQDADIGVRHAESFAAIEDAVTT
jgi:HK97 family phage major capsid protein/HK97 family phage prohead protease